MNRRRFSSFFRHGSLPAMAGKPGLSLVMALFCGLALNGWGHPGPAAAAERLVPFPQTPATEGTQAGLELLPPLPFRGATLDLPRVRKEREELLASANQAQMADSSDYPVSPNGATQLHLDVGRARLEGEKWIEVSLSDQMLYAWDGDQLVNEFLISSGVQTYPTITGVFRMWARTPSQTMSGGDRASGTYYNLPNVQWVQYFYGEFALHGTYWHNNFGTPMSHGCVNLTIEDAEWLFNWTFPEWDGAGGWIRTTENDATLVWVHR
ncbi:MAG: L,D-transpeptidase [Caldilineaceae bacterium SB0661_bin_32]|uniref:L,D-transpeptidase n=1 Tax=Caldilineaceae bacterium SB0661_bin_32 TaxID=2605255 RepID=A0A6B1DC65_9CHLR|nr:L,D-transpeptidase [Caldilineaceae bacterium SB0661_bin_32]